LRPSMPGTAAHARAMLPMLARIAAALAIAALLGIAASNFMPHSQERTFATPIGGRETISFADGSKVELNTNTVLRTRMTTDQRIVWLDKGEAYFEVRHDPVHPFTVIAGDRNVTDLGTAFSVRREPDQLRIAVLEGRVRFGSAGAQARSQVLTQGYVAAATGNAMVVSKRSIQSLTNELSWRQGVLVFDEAALGEAAAEFNRYNSEHLVIADPEVARLVIDGTLPTNDIDGFARLAQTVLGLHVERHANEIVISR
jgi:transmembrane sensor